MRTQEIDISLSEEKAVLFSATTDEGIELMDFLSEIHKKFPHGSLKGLKLVPSVQDEVPIIAVIGAK